MGCVFAGLSATHDSDNPDACEGVSLAQQGHLLGQQSCLCRHPNTQHLRRGVGPCVYYYSFLQLSVCEIRRL